MSEEPIELQPQEQLDEAIPTAWWAAGDAAMHEAEEGEDE